MRIAQAILVATAAFLLGCQAFGGSDEKNVKVDYASDADSNLKLGIEALDDKNYLEAEKYFEYVKGKYPFLEAAKEAELKLADTDFDREQYLEARDKYQAFVKLHPTHPKVDYAAFRAALTHYKEIPSDLFILPPSEEKDQTEIRSSYRAMQDFVRQYPKSEYLAEAQKSVEEVKRRLAEHELYVADFYARRDRWPAVVGRLNNVVKNYWGVGFDERALFGIHDAYVKMKDEAKAKETLQTIISKMPGTDAAARAQKMLGG